MEKVLHNGESRQPMHQEQDASIHHISPFKDLEGSLLRPRILCISEPFYTRENIIEEDEEYYYQFRLFMHLLCTLHYISQANLQQQSSGTWEQHLSINGNHHF